MATDYKFKGNAIIVTEVDFDFSRALELLKEEHRVARKSWNKEKWLGLQTPGKTSYMTIPYIYINCLPGTSKLYPDGYRVSWLPNHDDLFANDYYIVGYDDTDYNEEDLNGTF